MTWFYSWVEKLFPDLRLVIMPHCFIRIAGTGCAASYKAEVALLLNEGASDRQHGKKFMFLYLVVAEFERSHLICN